jgi:hypothetical protein
LRPTGLRRERGRKIDLFLHAGAHDLLGSKHLTSPPAILKDLETRPRQMMLLDELGDLVRGLKDISSHKAEIPRYFKSLFSSTDRSEYKNYANGKSIIVKWHHFSFYGTSTPESFWENPNYSDVTGGFLARTLLLESGHEAPMPKVIYATTSTNRHVDNFSESTFSHARTRIRMYLYIYLYLLTLYYIYTLKGNKQRRPGLSALVVVVDASPRAPPNPNLTVTIGDGCTAAQESLCHARMERKCFD